MSLCAGPGPAGGKLGVRENTHEVSPVSVLTRRKDCFSPQALHVHLTLFFIYNKMSEIWFRLGPGSGAEVMQV